MGVLMTALLGTFRHLVLRSRDQAIMTEEGAARELVYQKLRSCLCQASGPVLLDESEGYPSLIFSYDNGADRDPQFSHVVTSSLFLREKALFLRTENAEGARKEEVLARPVQECTFTFFNGKKWTPSWEDASSVPALIKVAVDKTPFVFFLPPSLNMIPYP